MDVESPWTDAVFLTLVQLALTTLVGGIVLRLSIAFHNASVGERSSNAVPMPDRARAMLIVFLANAFHLLLGLALTGFQGNQLAPTSPSPMRWEEEQESDPGLPRRTWGQYLVPRAILALRAFILGFALMVVTRLVLPTTPGRAFLVTGNYWLVGYAFLAVIFFMYGLEAFLPASEP